MLPLCVVQFDRAAGLQGVYLVAWAGHVGTPHPSHDAAVAN